MIIKSSKVNKAFAIALITTIILSISYILKVRILLGDNWIIYAFVRGIKTYGLEAFPKLSIYYKSYVTYYPLFLWIISDSLNLNPISIDLAVFLILFPSIATITYIIANKILAEETVSAITTLLFLFGGGNAWIARLLYTDKFWTASYLSLDAYFGDNWLVTGLWAYKALSLFFAISSALLFIETQLLKGRFSRTLSALYLGTISSCISISILDYPYGILFVIGMLLTTSLFTGFLRGKAHNKLQLKKAIIRVLLISIIATVIVASADMAWGKLLGEFMENRLIHFYRLHINAYITIFLILLGGLFSSFCTYELGFMIASWTKYQELRLTEKNGYKNDMFQQTVSTLILITLGLLTFAFLSWLLDPQPQEYLLPLTNWPLKYAVARYSFLFLLALFIAILAYRQGHTHAAFINLLSIILALAASTLIPLPVKRRTLIPLKIALAIAIGYGIKIINSGKAKNVNVKSKKDKLRRKITFVCLAVLFTFSVTSSGYFWYNILQMEYPVNEIDLSNWVIHNTPTNLNCRFLTSSEWRTTKSIKWLAAKPNVTQLEPSNLSDIFDLILKNIKESKEVYIVVNKLSTNGRKIDDALTPLKINDFITSLYENDAYKVYKTTNKFNEILEKSAILKQPLNVISISNILFYESFNDYDAPGVYKNAIFVNDSRITIQNNLTFHGEFALSLWLKIEEKGEVLFMGYNSGYIRVRTNNQESLTLILHHKNIEKLAHISIKAPYNKWIHLFIQSDGNKLEIYENGVLISHLKNEIIAWLANGTINCIKISDKLWWDRGFQGFIDEIIILNRTISYEDMLIMYTSYGNMG